MTVDEIDDLRRNGSIQDALPHGECEIKKQLELTERSLEKMKKIYGRLLYGKERSGDRNKFYSEHEEIKKRIAWKEKSTTT